MIFIEANTCIFQAFLESSLGVTEPVIRLLCLLDGSESTLHAEHFQVSQNVQPAIHILHVVDAVDASKYVSDVFEFPVAEAFIIYSQQTYEAFQVLLLTYQEILQPAAELLHHFSDVLHVGDSLGV